MSLGDLADLRLGLTNSLFVDFDGTLAEIGPDPDAVGLTPDAAAALGRLAARLGGAVAVLSGRDLRDLARRTPPEVWRAGGHGLEILPPGEEPPAPPPPPPEAVLAPLRAATRTPGVRLELKGPVAALHFRAAPAAEAACLAAAEAAAAAVPGLVRQPGKMVVEVKPAAAHKGSALRRLVVCAAVRRPPAGDARRRHHRRGRNRRGSGSRRHRGEDRPRPLGGPAAGPRARRGAGLARPRVRGGLSPR